MLVNELRIGNFLKSLNGHIVSITKIEVETASVKAAELGNLVDTSYDYLQPIELSAAIFEDNGFGVLSGDDHPLYYHEKMASSIYFEYSSPDVYSLCYSSDEGITIDVLRSIRYVHELQNIFYALTGFELSMEAPQ